MKEFLHALHIELLASSSMFSTERVYQRYLLKLDVILSAQLLPWKHNSSMHLQMNNSSMPHHSPQDDHTPFSMKTL